MNPLGTTPIWDLFLLGVVFLFLLDWLFYQPLFKSLFASEHGREWKALSAGRRILEAGFWLVALGVAGLGPEPFRALGWGALWMIFRRLYINRRWNSVRRGCGAPGFMSHWTAFWIFAVEVARLLDGTGWLVGQIFTALRMDFAVIMLCAGSYKISVGFLKGNGMEFGRVNPIWGYHWHHFVGKNPGGLYPKTMNVLAAAGEVLAGILLLVPHPLPQLAGAALVSLSFFYVSLFIRLGRLAWLMVLLPGFYLPEVMSTAQMSTPYVQLSPPWLFLAAAPFWLFMALLPFLKFTQYYNLFANRTLPQPFQTFFVKVANFIPVIMWRVFTPDVINFFLRISQVDGARKTVLVDEATTYSYKNWKNPWLKLRFLHVTESIAIVSVFTTLKYFPSKPRLFEEKLVRYAKSVAAEVSSPCRGLEFEYISICKTRDKWEFRPVLRFFVDLTTGQIVRQVLDPEFNAGQPALYSPVRESLRPGGFEPARLN
jgi:hypothetical protein